MPAIAQNAKLDLLVEATSRVNYGKAIIDRKGITEKVEIETDFGKNKISDWQIYSFPVDYAFQKAKKYKKAKAHNAAWYRSTFQLKETGDTFLDMSTWGKGMVWVNGHNIGRFWDIGPSQTMYMPGAWLKKGKNEIIVFDLKQPEKAVVQGLNKPILSMLKPDESILHRKPGEDLLLKDAEPIAQGLLPNESGWQTIVLDKARKGRYFVIEACSAQDKNDTVASLAEIEITGTDGNPLSTLHWNVLYADSEDLLSGSTADKLFDAQETVMWQTNLYNKNAAHPHRVLIDLGENVTVKSIKVLPRRDNLKTGMIKEYKIYLQETPFIIEKK